MVINYNYLLILALGAHLLTAGGTCAQQPDHDCTCTGSLSSCSETRPLRSLPSFGMMQDYKTALLCSHKTHSDLLVSLVSGKAAKQRVHYVYLLYFLSIKKILKVCRCLQHEMTTGGLIFVCFNL